MAYDAGETVCDNRIADETVCDMIAEETVCDNRIADETACAVGGNMRQLMKYRVVDETVCDEDSMATASERSDSL
jgi:hypothetical protein